MKTRPIRHSLRRSAYTLIEIVAAGAFIAVGIVGAVSLSSSLMVQEELNWRIAIARNYQENIARLWQLGLTPGEVMNLMPSTSSNARLAEVIAPGTTLTPTGTVNEDGLGVMEAAVCNVTINAANITGAGAGGTNVISIYRPSLR